MERKLSIFLFALTLLFLFSFFRVDSKLSSFPLFFFITLFFAAIFWFEQDFQEEVRFSAFSQTLLHLFDRGLWYLSKLTLHTLFLFLFQCLFYLLSILFFNLPPPLSHLELLALFLLTALGLSGLGTSLAAASSASFLSYKLLPLLLFPLSLPLLASAIAELSRLLALSSSSSSLLFSLFFDGLFVPLLYLFFPKLVE